MVARRAAERKPFKCQRCGWRWFSSMSSKPNVCPKCHSAYWDKPRRTEVSDA